MGDSTTSCAATDAPPAQPASAKAILFVVAVLCALPTSGLFDGWPLGVKIANLIVLGLAAIGYRNQGVALKRAHAAGKLAQARIVVSPPQS